MENNSKKGILFISCEEAKHICDKAQYNEASLWEKIELNIRLSWCKFTKAYYKNNTKLTQKLKESQVECLDEECKERMKKELDKAMKDAV